MKGLAQDIANQTFKKCYLLYGEENYLLKQYRDKLRNALVPEGDTMNYNYYTGKEFEVQEVIDQAETMPFFADRRVIFLEETGLLKAGGEALAEFLLDSPEECVIVFVETSVDKRSKLYKTISSKGKICEFNIQPEETVRKWILTRIKKEGKNIDIAAMDALIERTGTDMSVINIELEKLFTYTLNKPAISAKDIEDIITVSTSAKIFDMIAAVAEKKQAKALEMYHDLLMHKETPFGILALIGRQFNLMLQVKELKETRYSSKTIAEKVGLSPFIEQKYERQASKFSYSKLRKALEACAKADEDVKMGRIAPELSVELLIIEYSK